MYSNNIIEYSKVIADWNNKLQICIIGNVIK